MYYNKQSNDAIDDVLNRCSVAEDDGTTEVPGMTYEMGVKAGIEWIISETYPHPLEG